MLRFVQLVVRCVSLAVLTACLLAAQTPQQNVPPATRQAAKLEATLEKVSLQDWRFNGFEEVNGAAPSETPWEPFLTPTKGYVAMFINPSQDISNSGKGEAAQGTRHPQFSLWIFPRTGNDTLKSLTGHGYGMVQRSAPSFVGAGKEYFLFWIGDIANEEARTQVIRLANALEITVTGVN